MRAGRVESYIHSDSITEHKGGVIFLVTCKSDAAAKTDEFKAFCRAIGPLVYAWAVAESDMEEAGGNIQAKIEEVFPDIAAVRKEVEKVLKESVAVSEIHWITL